MGDIEFQEFLKENDGKSFVVFSRDYSDERRVTQEKKKECEFQDYFIEKICDRILHKRELLKLTKKKSNSRR